MRGYRTARCGGLTGSARPEHRSDITKAIDIDSVAAQVAAAVGLAEGESGIRDILGAILDAEPASVREVARLAELATAAVRSAGGHVLDRSSVVFPNGAVTLVLILAESHLSIHTWPEENLIAIDLFSCGAIDGQAVIEHLERVLRLESVRVRQVDRGR